MSENKLDDCIDFFCTCSLEPESTSHFFLPCNHYNTIRSILLKDLNSVDKNLFKLSDKELTLILLYGNIQYSLLWTITLYWTPKKSTWKTLNVSLGLYFSVFPRMPLTHSMWFKSSKCLKLLLVITLIIWINFRKTQIKLIFTIIITFVIIHFTSSIFILIILIA